MSMVVKIGGYPVTTRFGEIDEVHSIPHKGLDIGLPMNTPVQSIGDGVITSLTDEGSKSFGKSIHMHLNNGSDVIYGHLAGFNTKVGEYVHQGDAIGLSGNTGDSTGPHLHLQVMNHGVAVDPTPYLKLSSPQKDIPWWDLKDQALAAGEAFKEWLGQQLIDLGIGLLHGLEALLDVALPTAAMVGILWWMVPFFPKSNKGLKLTGSSLLIYLFYILIRGGYQ